MRKMSLVSLITVIWLVGCSEDGFPEVAEEKKITEHVGEQAQISTLASQQYTWNEKITKISTNGQPAAAKFKELEQFATQYVTNAEELQQFTETVLATYGAHTYLQNDTNHKEMLTRIFQAFVVERNATEYLKDFVRAYYENITSIYTAKLTLDDEIIQQNEAIMAHALTKYAQ